MESFESCMISAQNQQPEMVQSVTEQIQQQSSQIESEESHNGMHSQHQQNQQSTTPLIQIQPSTQLNSTLTPVRLPAILDGEFFTVIRVQETNVTVRCLQCQKLLNGNLKSTGNFLSHVKRVHPFLIEKIKTKSNQRKPATVYIDMTADSCPEIVRTKRGYRKCYKSEKYPPGTDEACDQPIEWSESPISRRRRSEEPNDSSEILKLSHNNSFVVEDEFDAIGRNVAAKLRNMRLDQRIISEKLLNDILFEAQLGNLHRDSSIHI
ncbi:uncharacterized protein LOC105684733 isoform X2 [Athalia rosae]|nr:uncharacterized protein LOC105684733 isoform X2 [Athalia rosae]